MSNLALPSLTGIQVVLGRISEKPQYPFTLPFIRTLNLRFTSAITFFAGENGTGKTTVLAAIASMCGFSPAGGPRLDREVSFDRTNLLAAALRADFRQTPRRGFYLKSGMTVGEMEPGRSEG